MSSAILKSLLCLFFLCAAWYTDQFYKRDWPFGWWWKRGLKSAFFPIPSNQTRPGKAFIPTDFSCRGLAVTLSLKQLLLLVLQAPNPNPIHQPGWTSSHGRISLPKAVLWVFGPCNTESQFSLVSASLQALHPLFIVVHTQLQCWPVGSCSRMRTTAGKAGIPGKDMKSQLCRGGNFTTTWQEEVLTPLNWPLFCKALCNTSKPFKYIG